MVQPYLGGKYKRFQLDIDAPTSNGTPASVDSTRYHRMCYVCFAHSLHGVVVEVTRGQHRGKLQCDNCSRLLRGFYLWDTATRVIIAKVRHDTNRQTCPVQWSRAFHKSTKYLEVQT